MPTFIPNILTIYRGDTFQRKFFFGIKNDEGVVIGVDLTAWGTQWTGHLRANADASTTTAFSVDTSQAAQGYITITLDSDRTVDLPAKGLWDLQVVDTTLTPPRVTTMVQGVFVFEKDVTS